MGSLLVRHNCKVKAFSLGHYHGNRYDYFPGLYSLNKFFWLGEANDGPSVSKYGWGAFKCECNLTNMG